MIEPKAAAAQNIAPVERSPGAEDAAPSVAPIHGLCLECGHETEVRHDDDWLCSWCHEAIIRAQEEDKRLDDPRHGQAAEINRRR